MASSWLDFWNGTHRIYVNARHAQVHYAKIAADFIALIASTDAIVVDWGCGEASQALTVAAHDGHGERVERPADLPAALRRAAAAVRGGQQALVNVICPP